MGPKGALEGPGSGFWRPRRGPDGAEMEPKCAPEAFSERSENRARLGSRLGAVLEPEKGLDRSWEGLDRSRAAEWRRLPGGG